jgi:transposase
MPFKSEKFKFDNPFFDRRCKLIPCQKEMIKHYYGEGESIRSLARRFSVSKRTIQFELFPERKVQNLIRREERGGSKIYYVGGEVWASQQREHRKHKKQVFDKIQNLKNQ